MPVHRSAEALSAAMVRQHIDSCSDHLSLDSVASAVQPALDHNVLVAQERDNDLMTLAVVAHIDTDTFDTGDDTVALDAHTAYYSMVSVVAFPDSRYTHHGVAVVAPIL